MAGGTRSRRARRHIGAAFGLSIALSLVLVSDALGVSWIANRALTAGGFAWAWAGSLAVSSTTIAHAVYEERVVGNWGVYYRRTANSGTTWATPIRLSRASVCDAGAPSIDAYGSGVDAVWLESDDILAGLDTVIMYRRSTDAGVSWADAVPLTPSQESAGMPRVARRGAFLAVTWTNEANGKVYVRVSKDGGVTWQPRVYLGTTTRKLGTRYEGFPVVGIGTGVTYVSFYSAAHTLKIRRSTTSGATWWGGIALATNGSGWDPTVAAAGSTVIVGYAATTSTDSWTVIRRSTDKGAHWGTPIALSARTSYPSFSPVLSVRGTRWMAIYERCSSNSCAASDVLYRASGTSGRTWSAPVRASVRVRKWEAPADVDVATRTLVLYVDYNSTRSDVYVRQGS
jgi:hypothetical protein